MGMITIRGKNNPHLFSTTSIDDINLPDWGGIYVLVRASNMGHAIEQVVDFGATVSFSKYSDKIMERIDAATHVYLLPECSTTRLCAILQDLIHTQLFINTTPHLAGLSIDINQSYVA